MEIMAVFTGRFHPFHKGHASSFNQLADQFGLEHTLLAISGKQEQPKSPFTVGDRAKMAMALGIPKENIIAINQPYRAEEYIKYIQDRGLDPQNFALVFAVSKKDMEGVPEMGIPPDPRFTFKPKRDGSPSYLQPYSGNEDSLQNMMKHAYIVSTDVAEFPIAGQTMRDASAIRKAYISGDKQTKRDILHDLYGRAAKHIKPIFDRELKSVDEVIREYYSRIKPLLVEATVEKKLQVMNTLLDARERMLNLNEFAPSDSGDGGEFNEDALKRMAAAWWNGDSQEEIRIEKMLKHAGWEIGQDEGYDDGGVFVILIGDTQGHSYLSWSAEDLSQVDEARRRHRKAKSKRVAYGGWWGGLGNDSGEGGGEGVAETSSSKTISSRDVEGFNNWLKIQKAAREDKGATLNIGGTSINLSSETVKRTFEFVKKQIGAKKQREITTFLSSPKFHDLLLKSEPTRIPKSLNEFVQGGRVTEDSTSNLDSKLQVGDFVYGKDKSGKYYQAIVLQIVGKSAKLAIWSGFTLQPDMRFITKISDRVKNYFNPSSSADSDIQRGDWVETEDRYGTKHQGIVLRTWTHPGKVSYRFALMAICDGIIVDADIGQLERRNDMSDRYNAKIGASEGKNRSAQQAAGIKSKSMKESIASVNRLKLVDLIEKSMFALRSATPQQQQRLKTLIAEARARLTTKNILESALTYMPDIQLLEQELRDKNVFLWPDSDDVQSCQWVSENYTMITATRQNLKQLLHEHFADSSLSKDQLNTICKTLISRNIERELNYAGVRKTVLDETVNYDNPQLKRIVDSFADFATDNKIEIGDSVCVLQLEIAKYHPSIRRGHIILRGFTTPKVVDHIDNLSIGFDDGSEWPNVSDYRQPKIAKQTIFFTDADRADQCATFMTMLSSEVNSNDEYVFQIHVNQDESLDRINENWSAQQIIDYIDEC